MAGTRRDRDREPPGFPARARPRFRLGRARLGGWQAAGVRAGTRPDPRRLRPRGQTAHGPARAGGGRGGPGRAAAIHRAERRGRPAARRGELLLGRGPARPRARYAPRMTDLADFAGLVARDHGLAVVSVLRPDGTVLSSVVK